MNRNRRGLLFINAIVLVACLVAASAAQAQDRERAFFSPPDNRRLDAVTDAAHPPTIEDRCRGPISMVTDVAYEGLKTTAHNWSNVGGGGESGRFDKRPVLSTLVNLDEGTCLNAHFSAIVGSRQTYGPAVARLTMFQVTLTSTTGAAAPQHMLGHYDTPYGLYGPAVAIEAERDVDTFSANFFQPVGFQQGDVPPGGYVVDVWWSGGPIGGGGAIGGAFVLKLYSKLPGQ